MPSAARRLERGEELLLLRKADPRRGLVEDEGAGAQPEKTQYLELLALADGQRIDIGLGIEVEIRSGRRAHGTPWRRFCDSGSRPPTPSEDEVVQELHGREVEGVLVQHAHAMADGVGRRADGDAILPSRTISPESGVWKPDNIFMSVLFPAPFSPRMPWMEAEGISSEIARVRADRAECLIDVAQLDQHSPFLSLTSSSRLQGDFSNGGWRKKNVASGQPCRTEKPQRHRDSDYVEIRM